MLLKDELFNIEKVTILADAIFSQDKHFKKDDFIQDCVVSFPPLELKERMTSVSNHLEKYLNGTFQENLALFSDALLHHTTPMFMFGAILEYVERNGCNDQYVDLSLEKLGEFTKHFSAEFAIRPFLSKYPDKTMEYVVKWAKSKDYHQRRLASEGTRPSLPWAPKITLDYKTASTALDFLYYDKERYVTRSVANHLNDISKIDPMFVLEMLSRWDKSSKQNEKEMTYIIQHSLRTLVKKGHMETLQFLGYIKKPNIVVSNVSLSSHKIAVGDTIEFTFDLLSQDDCKLVIDYRIYYPTKNGRRTSKTYKLQNLTITPSKTYSIVGRRSFKPISTRNFYAGTHQLDIQVNGSIVASSSFELE